MRAEIRTTHVGSLPRSAEVTDLLFAAERGERVDDRQFDQTMAAAVDETVRRQVAAGIDLVSDGEMAKISYATYIKDRITGFDGDSPAPPAGRPRGLPELPGAPGQQRRHPDLPPAALRRRGQAADPGAAGRRPAPLRRGAGAARRSRPGS